eukprot:10843586-Ditylum_brightwellii.AAC.1
MMARSKVLYCVAPLEVALLGSCTVVAGDTTLRSVVWNTGSDCGMILFRAGLIGMKPGGCDG